MDLGHMGRNGDSCALFLFLITHLTLLLSGSDPQALQDKPIIVFVVLYFLTFKDYSYTRFFLKNADYLYYYKL